MNDFEGSQALLRSGKSSRMSEASNATCSTKSTNEVSSDDATQFVVGFTDIAVPPNFSLASAICSYGYFGLPPNNWVPAEDSDPDDDHGSFTRPLRFGTTNQKCTSVTITLQQHPSTPNDASKTNLKTVNNGNINTEPTTKWLRIDMDPPIDASDVPKIVGQVCRICRLGEATCGDTEATESSGIDDSDANKCGKVLPICEYKRGGGFDDVEHEWYAMNDEASSRKFGRIFRSPTLWEDMVKTFLVCNVNWQRSIRMNRLLCDVVSSHKGSFPSPEDVLRHSADDLKHLCRLGYRNNRLHRLAQGFVAGEVCVDWFEDKHRRREEVYKKLRCIDGMGPFSAENMLQLLGFFDAIPYDSETDRHFKAVKRVPSDCKRTKTFEAAKTFYRRFSPFAFIAYWYELWKGYEARSGTVACRWKRKVITPTDDSPKISKRGANTNTGETSESSDSKTIASTRKRRTSESSKTEGPSLRMKRLKPSEESSTVLQTVASNGSAYLEHVMCGNLPQ